MARRGTSSYQLQVDGLTAEINYKDVRQLRLRILPPEGRLAVSVPLGLPERQVVAFIRQQKDWILTSSQRIRMAAPVVEPIVEGGRAKLWGQWRQLRIVPGERSSASLQDEVIVLSGKDESSRRQGLDRLYRSQIQDLLPDLLNTWQDRIGRSASTVRLRRMKTRWGTCNTVTAAVTLNLALAEYPSTALEYVLVHELAHLLERGHGPAFAAIMDAQLPDWRQRRAGLRER